MPPPPTQSFVPPRRDFIGKPAPPGYVAGIGRGATGFTTRSDIGPAREASTFARPDEDGAGPSKARGSQVKRSANDDEEEEVDLNESNYDEFAGYGGSLFSRDPYEEDDEEADKIYAEIDKHIDERGKALREARARQELEVYRQKRPKIQQQFIDLKANLKQVSEDEWASIPDVGDARNRKQRVARQDKFTPVPDSVLAHQARLASGGERLVYLDPNAMDDSDEEADNREAEDDPKLDRKPRLDDDGQRLNIGEMSDFRSMKLSMKLSRISDSNNTTGDTSQQTSATNPHDYLTNLQSMIPNQITDTATVNEYRKQFAALRASNPTFTNGWIASVRLEEAAGKVSTAKALILAACEKIPKSPDLWLEAARLHPPDIAKALMVKAIKKNPRNVRLWIKAAELEADEESRRRAYAKAREFVPRSEEIWRKSIDLEQPKQARILLRQAVKACPKTVEFWVALSKLSPFDEAIQILNEAKQKIPMDRSVWLTEAKLQEEMGNLEQIREIIKQSLSALKAQGVEIKRADWLQEAVDADRANCKLTCREIIRQIIGLDVPKENRLKQWLLDAQCFIDNKSIECARAVFSVITEDQSFCKLEPAWLDYARFEVKHGDKNSLIGCLKRAVQPEHCSKSEKLWLELAGQTSDLAECRRTLKQALRANPDSERIVLAFVNLEDEKGNIEVARSILAEACKSAKTPELIMRAARLECKLGNLEEALRMLTDGVKEYKNYTKFYLSLGEIEDKRGNVEKAKSWYSSGLNVNKKSVELWISMAKLEERTGAIARARSRLEKARQENPKNVELWIESAKLELGQYLNKMRGSHQQGRPDMVTTILAKGIRECKDEPEVEKLREFQTRVGASKGKIDELKKLMSC